MARRRKMDPERKAFISSLLEHYQPKDAQDVQDMLKDLLGETGKTGTGATPSLRPGHAERPARRNAARYVRS